MANLSLPFKNIVKNMMLFHLKQQHPGSLLRSSESTNQSLCRIKQADYTLKIKILISVLITLIAFQAGSGQNFDPRFEHLSLEKGISHNLTNCIFQDSRGFMWFGTLFGLIKYDGRKYTTFRQKIDDRQSISHDDVLCIIEDRRGYLWIGTDNAIHSLQL